MVSNWLLRPSFQNLATSYFLLIFMNLNLTHFDLFFETHLILFLYLYILMIILLLVLIQLSYLILFPLLVHLFLSKTLDIFITFYVLKFIKPIRVFSCLNQNISMISSLGQTCIMQNLWQP